MTIRGYWREFAPENRRAILSDYGVINQVHYLFPQGGGPRGSVTTFAELKGRLKNRDLILFSGVLLEQAITPVDVFDVAIVGAANRPRQATDGGVATGGGASWLAPASPTATTPLLKVIEQGWSFENIMMQPVAASACLRFSRAEVATDMDGSHFTIDGCYMVGGGALGIGIEDVGGCSRGLIKGSRFEALSGCAIKGISTGIAVPTGWVIEDNEFRENLNDIKMSLTYSTITRNKHHTAGAGATNKIVSTVAISAQGGYNLVVLNHFNNAVAAIVAANGFSGAATDMWGNYVTDQAALAVGQPTP